MKLIDTATKSGLAAAKKLDRRADPGTEVCSTVATHLAAVHERGDAALIELAEKFDRVKLTTKTLAVTQAEIDTAARALPAATRRVLAASHKNVTAFARAGLRKSWKMKNAQGAEVGERYAGFDRVGIYVPGGTAPLVSTVLMTVTLAKVAGCREIVVTTPCGADGKIHPALLAALKLAGATEVYRLGGIQAVGALAYGTKTIRPVDKIFGPGNKWVVEAKRQVFGRVAVDLLPGPSEILVLADDSARPDWIAADLLAQAEHGHDGMVVCVSPSQSVLDATIAALKSQAATLSRQAALKECELVFVKVRDMEEGLALTNAFAPEHLSLIARDEARLVPRLTSTGAIFLGNHSPVAVGDFLAGPSHTLPTGGAGKSFPGLTVDAFQRRTSVVKLSAEAIRKSAPIVEAFALLEGLDAHARSATIRTEA